MSAITRKLRLPRLSAPRLRLPRPRTLVALTLVVMLLGGGWFWLRGSSLVAVDRVTVTGLRGPGSGAIRAALLGAARGMTTLEVNLPALQASVAPFPVVKGLKVSTQFPHGMRIRVLEQVAVGAVTAGGRRVAVAGDGTLLPTVTAAGLPSVSGATPAPGGHVTGSAARGAVALLAAAPRWLRSRVTQVSTTSANGLVAELHNGPELRFGAASQLRAKWTAVVAVLADQSSQGAAYIDVSVPERPAAGGVAVVAATTGTAATATAATTGAAAATTGAAAATTGAAGATTDVAGAATGATAPPTAGAATGATAPAATGSTGG
ncbi:MAG: cell division protein FtsQ [Solirubrobacteraceae bacterium]|nr:cell division protein FtsQ [Solirubrobacteraceae bacterium]